MDLLTILLLICLAAGGIAYDAYEHPKTLIVNIVHRGSDTGTGLDKGGGDVLVSGGYRPPLMTNPYLELARVHATLSFSADAVTLRPPLGVTQ